MNKLLKNNHATIFSVSFYDYDKKKRNAHALVAYKRNNIVEYFDPQTDKKNKNKTSIVITMKPYGDLKLESFKFHFVNYKTQEDILIDDTTCVENCR